MTEHISLLTENFNNIKECFSHDKSHKFCGDCLERKSFDDDPCQLCRPFYSISDSGYRGYSREYLLEKLVNLHQSCVESILSVDENKIDIPLVEKFILGPVSTDYYESKLVAWLDSKIYVSYRFGIRVFTDQTPFTELPERIKISKLGLPSAMVASTSSNSILISDSIEFCIWKIQLPDHRISRIGVRSEAGHLSITPDDELLVVVGEIYFDTFSLNDFSKTNSIDVPFYCSSIPCAAQLSNTNIIFSYSTDQLPVEIFSICLMTTEGNVTRKFDPSAFEPNQPHPWCPQNFAINDAGQIFIADARYGRLFVFNSEMTDFHTVSNIEFDSHEGQTVHYVKGRQQLLVRDESVDGIMSLSVLHLSPCNLIRGRNDRVMMPASNPSRLKRKRKAYKFSTWNFQKLGMKRRRY